MKRKLNITGIIGLVAALGLIAFIGMAYGTDANGKPAVIMSQMMNFWDPASVAITVGGTIGGVIFMFPAKILKNAGKMMGMVFNQRKYNPNEYIENMVEYCKIASLKGILQLEESANECKDPFMKSALMLIVDANDSEKVQAMLDDSIDFMCERHEANISMWLKASSSAPAFGMIGTLVGLINMLAALDPTDSGSAASLGAGMATALITTFYGCIMANVIFNPIANQLKYTHNDEVLCMQIIEEGALAIISGANPRYVQEKLEMMLPKNSGKSSKKQEK